MKKVIQKHPGERSLTSQSTEVKNKPLFSSARTRKSKEVNAAKNCKRIIEKKEITKFAVTKK